METKTKWHGANLMDNNQKANVNKIQISTVTIFRGFMYIYNILWLCAKIGYLCLFCHNCCVYLWYISHMASWMLFIFGIVISDYIMYHKNLMHMIVWSKFTPYQNWVNWAIFAVLNSDNKHMLNSDRDFRHGFHSENVVSWA